MSILDKLRFPTQDLKTVGGFFYEKLKPPVKDVKTILRAVPPAKTPFEAVKKTSSSILDRLKFPTKDIATIGRALPQVKTPLEAIKKTAIEVPKRTGSFILDKLRVPVKTGYKKTADYFKPTQDVRVRDVARQLPETGLKIAKFGTTVREEMSKSGGSLALSLHNIFADIKKEKRISEFIPSRDASKLEKGIHQFVFGKDSVKSIEQRMIEGEKTAREMGFGRASLPVSMFGVGAIVALDFTGIGGGRKVVTQMIAKADDVADIAKVLRQVGVAEDLILPTAKKMKTITKAVDIEKAFTKIELLQKSTKVSPAKPSVMDSLKYKSAEEQKFAEVMRKNIDTKLAELPKAKISDKYLDVMRKPKATGDDILLDSLLPTEKRLGKTLADEKYIVGGQAKTGKTLATPVETAIEKAKKIADSGGDGSVGNFEVYDFLKKVKDGRIKVYHGTSETGAEAIGSGWAGLKDGSYLSLTKEVSKEAPGVYGAKYYSDIADKYGKNGRVLEFDIPLKNLAVDKTTGEFRYVSTKIAKTPIAKAKPSPLIQEAKKFAEAGKDKYYFVRNVENKGGYIDGKPSLEGTGRFNQAFEPTGEYMNIVSKKGYDTALPNLKKGIVEFKNPLIIETDLSPAWKKQLSEKYGGLKRDELSQAIISDGYDGIFTMAKSGSGKSYISEVVDLKVLKKAQVAPEASKTLPTAVKAEEGIKLLTSPDKAGEGFIMKRLPKKEGASPRVRIKKEVKKSRAEAEKAKVILRAKEKTVDISESTYKANRETKKGIKQVIVKDTKDAVDNLKLGTDKFLGSISTRLKNIHPELKRGLRTFEYNTRQKTLQDTLKVKPFLNTTKKMSKNDLLDFDLARKNGDKSKIESLIKKYNLEKEHNALRKTLDDLYKRAEEVGYDIGYKESYHPRIIKDPKGFLNYFQRGDDWNIIGQAISAKENALHRYLNEEEKAQLINSMIRGYQQNNIALSEIGNMKARTINIVDTDINQFYMDSNSALLSYITKSNEAIEARKFFGKGEGTVVEDSIGGYVLRLMKEGKIKPDQEVIVSDILKARFKQQGTRGIVSTYKNLSYVDTMGSPISAITQIGDLAWSIYRAGFIRTAKGIIKSATGKVAIKKGDIGIDRIAEEFADQTKSAKAVSKVFKLVGLEKIDAIGKETLIDSVISKYKSWAKADNKRLIEKLKPVFGDDKKVLQEVIEDLKLGNNTENIKLLAFNELADVQPILLSEMPQKYLTGGNGRLFYMLKTFTLKQFDIYRNEIFQKIAKKETRAEGIKNLVSLTSAFVLMNATADEIKDFILNRKTSLEDRTVDNILRVAGFSKYLTWKVRTEGVGSGMARQILPPFKFIDSVSKDILKGVENGSEITQSIPLGGKLYYWWFGKGQYKTEHGETKTEKAEDIFKKINKAETQEEVNKLMKQIKDEDIGTEFKTAVKNEALGVSKKEKEIKKMPPKERAEYLKDKLFNAKSQEEIETILKRATDLNWWTTDTKEEFKNLLLEES